MWFGFGWGGCSDGLSCIYVTDELLFDSGGGEGSGGSQDRFCWHGRLRSTKDGCPTSLGVQVPTGLEPWA